LLALLLVGWVSRVVWAVDAVDVRQGAAMQSQGALLVDVRTPGEFDQVRAPGAVLIPLDQLGRRLNELGPQDRPIALICRSGNRSGQAQRQLQQAGFTRAVNVLGGMNAWEQAGLPVIRGK